MSVICLPLSQPPQSQDAFPLLQACSGLMLKVPAVPLGLVNAGLVPWLSHASRASRGVSQFLDYARDTLIKRSMVWTVVLRFQLSQTH